MVYIGGDIMDTERKLDDVLEEFKDHFDDVLDYLGDDELISSCNDEYTLQKNNWIVTDGVMHTSTQHGDNSTNTVCVRGATHVIICTWDKKAQRVRRTLYIDRPSAVSAYPLIMRELKMETLNRDDILYYIETYVGGNIV